MQRHDSIYQASIYQAIEQAALKGDQTAFEKIFNANHQDIKKIIHRNQNLVLPPLYTLARDGKVKAVDFLLTQGVDGAMAVYGYAVGNHPIERDKLLQKLGLNLDEIIFQIARKGVVISAEQMNVVFANNPSTIAAAVEGYAKGGFEDGVNELINKAGASRELAAACYAAGGHIKAMNELLKQSGLNTTDAARRLAQNNSHLAVVQALIDRGANAKSVAQSYTDINKKQALLFQNKLLAPVAASEKSNRTPASSTSTEIPATPIPPGPDPVTTPLTGEHNTSKSQPKKSLLDKDTLIPNDYKRKIQAQYTKQKSERNWRTFLVVLAAFIFTPFSLIFTILLWFMAKEKEPIQKLTTTRTEYDAVKKKRLALRGNEPKIIDADKPKKILYSESITELVFLVDKAQLRRYRLFSQQNLATLQSKKQEIAQSKDESKKIIQNLRP